LFLLINFNKIFKN